MKRLLAVLMVLMSATAACADIYTWKDNTGTRFYTNSLHEIPARYLKKARVLDVATGKLGGPATAQPPAPAAPAAAARSAAPAPMAQPQLVQTPAVPSPAAPEVTRLPQSAQTAAPQAANTPAAAAASPAAPVVERTPAAQNSTRPAGRLSRRELRAQSRHSNPVHEE